MGSVLGLFSYSFMRNAFSAIFAIGPMFGLISTMIVNNRMAFFSDALGHCALTGIALGTLIGIQNPTFSILIFALIFAFCISNIIELDIIPEDSIIGVFSSVGLAVGTIVISFKNNFSRYSEFLIGNLISIRENEVKLVFFVFIAVLIFWFLFFNKLMLSSFNRDLSVSKQLKYKFYKNIFVIMISLTVAVTIRLIGILMVNSLLTLPAAASKNISKNLRDYHIFSVVFSLSSGILGLIVSFYLGVSASASIILILSLIFFITLLVFRNNQ
ncbi:MAG: zinc ABC transporter permease [Candidatus Improbicoccus pseudotrichonymphae]|uniref:Zinc ABC transporter permease n=1 Tax=Candidatus Improbicoccus pseudotrichonymphae TaxID=3033792 RepID=A0AA48HUM8_9FIRM|nr:MAG: zinc ABC transporter permease [Candidatus Improbicoccus pseudotrichonymphae]